MILAVEGQIAKDDMNFSPCINFKNPSRLLARPLRVTSTLRLVQGKRFI